MASLKGSKTEQNLLKAFAGESQARNRYDYFASVAKKEGYEQISGYFAETALNEKEHAKRFFSFLEGGATEIVATYPAGKIGTTVENLKASAEGEHEEWAILYPEFARIAEEEEFLDVADTFKFVAKAETGHETRYLKLLKNIEKDQVFKRDSEKLWKCRNCGYLHDAEGAPDKCPACQHEKAFFELYSENY